MKESGGGIRLTTALYYTPSGRSIQGKGIDPDVQVEPALIETIATGGTMHEADLKGALKNTDTDNSANPAAKPAPGPSSNATPAKAITVPAAATPPTPNVPAGTTPALRPESAAIDPNTLGTGSDYQFVRAVDLLHGIKLFKAAQAAQ